MAALPKKIPVKPPEINMDTKPIENKLAELIRILPPQIVAIQLNTFTAEGTAMIRVNKINILAIKGFIPVMYM